MSEAGPQALPAAAPVTPVTLERTLPREAYLSPALFVREKDRIFCREWTLACREEDIPAAGDFLLVDLLGEKVLVVRGREGDLRAFYNVCRHRGCELALSAEEPACRGDGGPTGHLGATIRCPYHSWTYDLDGTLRTAPYLEEAHGFRKEDFHLFPVGLATWGGFVFLHLTPGEAAGSGHTLRAQLNGADDRLANYPLASLRRAKRIVYEVQANWKVILENYNECYHCAGVHPELCKIVPSFREQGGSNLDWERGVPHKEGATTFTFSGTTTRQPFPGLNADELVRHKGELIYPNMMISLSADHVAAFIVLPRSEAHTTVVCDFLFHPDEMARPDFDGRDAIGFWDLVNRQDWAICEGVQRGMTTRAFAGGFYAPMESFSLDIRRYIAARLGPTDLPETPR